jgi:hypothetical protein
VVTACENLRAAELAKGEFECPICGCSDNFWCWLLEGQTNFYNGIDFNMEDVTGTNYLTRLECHGCNTVLVDRTPMEAITIEDAILTGGES